MILMSESKRAALLLLSEIWALYPDFRLGQLFGVLGDLGEDQFGRGLGDIDDDEMMAVLARLRTDLAARAPRPQFAPVEQPAASSPA